jgi:hypothetical protein
MIKDIRVFTEAVQNLLPNVPLHIDGTEYENIHILDETKTKPSKEEVESEVERVRQYYQNTEYQRDRASAYPSIEEQLDVLYHQGYDGWKASIDEVKDKYPKPE